MNPDGGGGNWRYRKRKRHRRREKREESFITPLRTGVVCITIITIITSPPIGIGPARKNNQRLAQAHALTFLDQTGSSHTS
mmetsp:Transcript_21051/g.54497  ORF Transcript_21051/g.54497 Transcript_21051/m.54497 type:complete len:81 (+) Transcript_21051:534-776(+)